MAATQIADIIVPSVFVDYQVSRTKETSILFTSGIIAPNQMVQNAMVSGGKTFHLPFWKDLTGAATVSSDDPTSHATPRKITASEQVGVVLRRNTSFSAADLAAAVAGDDPMRTIADGINGYWNREFQGALLKTAQGAFGVLGSAAVVDITASSSPGAANAISGGAVIDAIGTMGDAADDIKIMAVHSRVFQALQKQNLIQFVPASDGKVQIPTYMGRVLLQSDAMPVSGSGATTKYTTYFFGTGAFAFGEVPAKTPVAVDRDELGADGEGVEYFINRRHVALHPVGFAWAGSPAGATPTNTELATSSNWSQVFDRKQIPMAALVTNIV